MGQNKYTPSPRKYFKSTFVDFLEKITPEVYRTEDVAMSGTEINPLSQVINTHLAAANKISSVLSISAVANSQTSSLDNISGISQYFVKQNELTNINPYLFENNILRPLDTALANYNTKAEFRTYLSGTLLPMIVPATGSKPGPIVQNISTLSALTGDPNASSVHNYLVDKLGWFYFLNTSANGGLEWDPSGYVLSSLERVFAGESLKTIDGIKGFEEFLWRNYETCTTFSNLGLIPDIFISGTADAIKDPSAGIVATYTSGTQKLDALQTLIDVIYSPLYIDQEDFTVKAAFDSYMGASISLTDLVSKGPFRKFLTGMAYSFADISDEVENIGLIYDIENVPEGYLQYIADLIGWKLLGSSPSKWRNQLRHAVSLYKKSGTLEAIQSAINNLIVNSVLDVTGSVSELWESYIPFLIWYSLATESPYFRNLETWTPALAITGGVGAYNTSSLEENLKLTTDSILLDLYRAYPDNFAYRGINFNPFRFRELDIHGNPLGIYTIVGSPTMQPFHIHQEGDLDYEYLERIAYINGEQDAWNAASSFGPLGTGIYMAGVDHPAPPERPTYLSSTGDINFVFNYRGRFNYPIPPFEELKYYADCPITGDMVELLAERLECFGVKGTFVTDVKNYILSGAVNTTTNLGAFNEFLMLFSSVQVPPNYSDVILNSSNYQKNLLGLWNGKSSHLFIDFDTATFDFSKTTMEADSRYAPQEAARIARIFTPSHAITKVNLNTSAADQWVASSVNWDYIGLDEDDTIGNDPSASVLGTYESSGVSMRTVAPGTDDGRGGLNTFVAAAVESITDTLLSSTTAVLAPRRAFRRRNLRYTLPKEGYYDRTGFNAPNGWDPSTLENSMPSSLGENTLGYVASAGKFFPILDPINPSGVWHKCEDLSSTKTFSGVATSSTFPYRGLREIQANSKMPEVGSSTTRYVDRFQTPGIYITMHKLFEALAIDYATVHTYPVVDGSWKDEIQSYANSAIASGLVLNSYDDYVNFNFGTGLQKTHLEYCKYFAKHPLGLNELDNTGANIFAQVFGKGLYNCDFDITGSAVSTMAGNYVASSVRTNVVPISYTNGSGVFSTCAVQSYHGDQAVPASGTYIAYGPGEAVLPLTGTYISPYNVNTAQYSDPSAYNAEFRNPHILSGVEFVQTSGAPTANEFIVFSLNNSLARKGWENYLIDNPVIKCKSSGGLPRLRFDLSSYGPRPNTFIKNHKFNLKIKSLIATEESQVLGGGQLGVWIHTKPKYLGNKNLLFYTDDPGSSPALDFAGGDTYGAFWASPAGTTNSFSSILETNPFGGVSSIELSGENTATSYTYLAANVLSSIEAAGYSARSRTLNTGYATIWSMYVKRPPSGYSPSSFFMMINDHEAPEHQVNNQYFDYQGTYTDATSAVPVARDHGHSYKSGYVEDVGNDWYRCSIWLSGLGNGVDDETLEGDQYDNRIYFVSSTDSPAYPNYSERLFLYAPQVEQWPIGIGPESRTTPSPYQAVVGNMPDLVTPDGYMWSWIHEGKWVMHKESDLSIDVVLGLSHVYNFNTKVPDSDQITKCIAWQKETSEFTPDISLLNIKEDYFETFEVEFNTHNETIHNNYQYLDIIPVSSEFAKIQPLVNMEDTQYYVEVFFVPQPATVGKLSKYLLIDSIELQDVTQRENAGIGLGHGVETDGTPLRHFIHENKLYLDKEQLRDVLKFYNGLAGVGTGIYATNLASRNAILTSGTMEVSGGSRLNYRLSPTWGATNADNTQANYNNFTRVELDN